MWNPAWRDPNIDYGTGLGMTSRRHETRGINPFKTGMYASNMPDSPYGYGFLGGMSGFLGRLGGQQSRNSYNSSSSRTYRVGYGDNQYEK